MLLLRGAVAALRKAGHSVSLLAPSGPGSALVGPGPGEVEAVLPWDGPAVARLFAAREAIDADALRLLSPFPAVIAYTGNHDLVRALGATGARVVAHPPLPPPDGPHAARWLAEAVGALGGDPSVTPPTMEAIAAEGERAREWLDRLPRTFLAVHPGSGSARKNWPRERFAALVDALAAGRPWLLAEGPADVESARALGEGPHVVHARALPPRVLGAILARAALYVGNDSGVSHLAAAWGAPTLALFGPTDPRQWAPVGPRVAVIRSGEGTMDSITVDAAVAAAQAMTGGPTIV